VPIPGTKVISRLDENAAAARLRLPSDHLAELDRMFSGERVSGARYGDAARRFLDE